MFYNSCNKQILANWYKLIWESNHWYKELRLLKFFLSVLWGHIDHYVLLGPCNLELWIEKSRHVYYNKWFAKMAKVCCFMCLYKHITSTLDETVSCTLVSNYLIHALDNLNKIAINFCLVLICFIMLIYLFLYNVYFKLVLRFTLSWWYVDMLVVMLIL